MIYIELFLSFLEIGFFSIGGGYAAMPLIEAQVVTGHEWLTMEEFTDLITIAEMTPGPIAVNSATFVGTRIAGFPGTLAATAGCIFPSLIIVSALALIYRKYRDLSALQNVLSCLRPAVVALIAAAGCSILRMVASGSTDTAHLPMESLWSRNLPPLGAVNLPALCLFILAFCALRRFRLNPILVMMACGFVYTALSLLPG